MARDHNSRRYAGGKAAPPGGMHLFDFNETLSGKRLPDDRRAALEFQMERLYKGRGSSDLSSSRTEQMIRNTPKVPDKKMHGAPEFVPKSYSSREMDTKQRGPSVVARLMGLDTLPNDSFPEKTLFNDSIPPTKQLKKKPVESPSKLEKQNWKQNQMTHDHAAIRKESYHVPFNQGEEKAKFSHPRFSDDRKRNAAKELPDLYELEEMKRQLAVKQMMVREKLNEAKRLLTGEKLADRKWLAASDNLNQSKEFLDAIDFFQTNRDAFLKYVDDQDSVLGKHIDSSSEKLSRHHIPDGLSNPIVRKVIEGRKEDALRNSARHSDYASEVNNMRRSAGDKQVATRIVVLKPSPNRIASPTSGSFSPGRYDYPKPQPQPQPQPQLQPQAPAVRRVVEEEATSNPREIAKEIARQVRESVVRDLARNAAAGSEKRLNVTIDNLEGPRLTRGTSSEVVRGGAADGATTPTGRASKPKSKASLEHLDETARKLSSSSQQKKSLRPRLASGSSSPVSKGIVVLIPDQSVGGRNGKASEVQNREIVSVTKATRGKDRTRRSQTTYLDSTSHKLGDTFRKSRSFEDKRSDLGGLTNSVKDDGRIGDCSSDSGPVSTSGPVSSGEVLGYGGSFLLKSSGFESQADNENASCEYSETKETVESEYTADVCVSDEPETLRLSSDCVSSCDSFPSEPSTVTVNQYEQEPPESPKERVFEALETSPECSVTDVEAVHETIQLVQEEESSKDTTTTDVVDVDETSVSSDNSGQPSPISVLESSFDETPAEPQVDFDTISSELEELRLQLRLLKWDGQDQTLVDDLDDSTSDSVVEKLVVKEVLEVKTASVVEAEERDELQWLELEAFDISNLHCPAGWKEEQNYIKNILLAAGLIRINDTSTFLVQHFSPKHALDPQLFQQLESYYSARSGEFQPQEQKKVAEDSHSSKRRLMFAMVDEILKQKFVWQPWVSTVRAVSCGGFLMGEVWAKLCDYFSYPQGEDLQHTVENLIEKYLTRGDRWMDLRGDVEGVGLELETMILEELLEETISSCL